MSAVHCIIVKHCRVAVIIETSFRLKCCECSGILLFLAFNSTHFAFTFCHLCINMISVGPRQRFSCTNIVLSALQSEIWIIKPTLSTIKSKSYKCHLMVILILRSISLRKLCVNSWHFVAKDFAKKAVYMAIQKKNIPTQWRFYVCLLYTSPSPRDGLLSRMPSSA